MKSLLAPLLSLVLLPGCFIFVDDREEPDPPPEPVNSAPYINPEESWWLCELDESNDDYFFEFQASVIDADGLWNVEEVAVTVYAEGDHESALDSFALYDEGEGIWAGVVWEDESNLFCGEAIDVLYEVWDEDGEYDRFLQRYGD